MFEIPFFSDTTKYDKVAVGLTPKELIFEENKLKFYRYKPVKEKLNPTPFLIIYALINKNYILDLVPNTSFIEYLVSSGIDTYIIDWGEPGDEDRFLELDYFIERYIHKAVKKTLEISGAQKLTMFGYCMGGHLSVIYSALHNEFIKNLIVLASPIDTEASKLINIWADKEQLNIEKLQSAFGNIPARVMQKIFGLIRDSMEKNYYGDIDAQEAVAKWSSDNIDIAGLAFVKYIKEIFQNNNLCKNKLNINSRFVKLNEIKSNLMVITGNHDWVAPFETTTALHTLVSSKNKQTVVIEGGHLAFIVRKNSKKVWQHIVDWHKKMDNESVSNDELIKEKKTKKSLDFVEEISFVENAKNKSGQKKKKENKVELKKRKSQT